MPADTAGSPATPEAPIPLVDLLVQHAQIADEVTSGFEQVISKSAFVNGEDVASFEDEFAAFSGVDHCVGVANGTDAMELALRAAGIGRGDEVIVPANTFVATAEAAVRAGATVRFVDCDERCQLIDVHQVAAAISPRTRAVVGVDLFGQIPLMDELASVTDAAGVLLLEDAAQAHGASRHGRSAGSFGVAAATSFYPGKNLGSYGDAGAVLTGSPAIARAVRALRNHGGSGSYQHATLGFNSRLDSLQAVVLRAKLRRLRSWNDERARAADRYENLLGDLAGVTPPKTLAGNVHVWHLYVVRVANRDVVLKRLRAAGIGAGVHYPVPVHLQPAFLASGPGPGGLPVAERAAVEILSLPMFPGITTSQQERVVEALAKALV